MGGGHLTGLVACLGDSGTLLAGTEPPHSSPLSRTDPCGGFVLPEVAANTSLVFRNCRV